MVALTFASHLLTDAYFTRYPVYLWWPLNRIPYSFAGGVWLGAPINTALVYGALVLAVVLAVARGVTPLDVFWPRLDRIVRNAFRAKPLACATCEAACNERCDGCEQPTCLRHGRIGWGFRIACPACGEGPAG